MHLPDYKEARTRDKRDYKRIEYSENSDVKDKYLGKTFYLKTYGCQMNEHDSENIEALLTFLGFSKVDNYTDADLVLLNTCSISLFPSSFEPDKSLILWNNPLFASKTAWK